MAINAFEVVLLESHFWRVEHKATQLLDNMPNLL
jgi:hypothetical protein